MRPESGSPTSTPAPAGTAGIDAAGVERILAARARRLAEGRGDEPDRGDVHEFVTFGLARERYGIGVEFVREIRQKAEITRVPCTPDFVAGVTGMRGRIVSVIDLKRFLRLRELGLSDKVMLLRSGPMEFGVLVDEVFGVERLPDRAVRPVPPNLPGRRGDFVYGLGPEGQILVDGSRLLEDRRLTVYEEILDERTAPAGGQKA